MSVIFSRAPLRISLGGGGTDLPSYYREHGGFLVSGAIDKYVYMLTHTVFQRRYRMKYSELEEVDEIGRDPPPDPARDAAAPLARQPAGDRLGRRRAGGHRDGLLRRLHRLPAQGPGARAPHLDHPGDLAEAACEIEIDVLGEPVGKQDPYVAAHGGICAYTFHPRRRGRRRAARARARRAAAAARPAAAVLHRRGALGLAGARRPGRALQGRRRADAREPAPHQGARAGEPRAARDGRPRGLRGADARALGAQAPALAGDGRRAHRPPLRARPAQRRDRRQAGRRRRRRLPARLRAAARGHQAGDGRGGRPGARVRLRVRRRLRERVRDERPLRVGDRRLRADRRQAGARRSGARTSCSRCYDVDAERGARRSPSATARACASARGAARRRPGRRRRRHRPRSARGARRAGAAGGRARARGEAGGRLDARRSTA